MTPPRDLSFKNHSVRLHGLDWGGAADGTPVILLHGVGGNAWAWGALAPLLRQALGDAYRIVAIDQRGHGDSDKPEQGYSPEQFGWDVLAVQDALGGRPMVLVGHSRGGWLSAFVTARWPERVSKTVLVDPARVTFASSKDADDFYAPVLGGLGPFASKEAAVAFAREHDPQARWTPERERSFLFGFHQQADGSLVGKIPPRVVDRLRQAREESDVGPALEGIKKPVLLLVATKASDWRKDQKLEYARRIPHARMEYVEGTHYLHLDDPERVAGLVVEFLVGERRT